MKKENIGRFLAIDPMSQFAAFDGEYLQTFKVNKEKPSLDFYNYILDIMLREHKYEAILMEYTYFLRGRGAVLWNSQKIIDGQRWVLKMFAELYKIPLIEYSPKAIKNSFTGKGNANKKDMKNRCKELEYDIKNDHEADAIGLYYHHLKQIGAE